MRAPLARRVTVHARHSCVRDQSLERLFDPLRSAPHARERNVIALRTDVCRWTTIVAVVAGNSFQL